MQGTRRVSGCFLFRASLRRVWRLMAACQATREGTRHTLRPGVTCEPRIMPLPPRCSTPRCSTPATEVVQTADDRGIILVTGRSLRALPHSWPEAQLTTQKEGRTRSCRISQSTMSHVQSWQFCFFSAPLQRQTLFISTSVIRLGRWDPFQI